MDMSDILRSAGAGYNVNNINVLNGHFFPCSNNCWFFKVYLGIICLIFYSFSKILLRRRGSEPPIMKISIYHTSE